MLLREQRMCSGTSESLITRTFRYYHIFLHHKTNSARIHFFLALHQTD